MFISLIRKALLWVKHVCAGIFTPVLTKTDVSPAVWCTKDLRPLLKRSDGTWVNKKQESESSLVNKSRPRSPGCACRAEVSAAIFSRLQSWWSQPRLGFELTLKACGFHSFIMDDLLWSRPSWILDEALVQRRWMWEWPVVLLPLLSRVPNH